ncbi:MULTISPECIES: hypothetical protein [unclassified Streptomyces]|uniref:hypothetical protein n=1 Tax=unclassified Streptomyces TaxID=2593676 RepID=UPI00137177D6|nr:hypothetical protein [Streptomyces sp. SHP 1-2]MCW5252227.1 hypothetical protein [Streptomyces sp. SHP 1-2]MYU24030.1 hypothetical protein [Streptomyces sp. SID8352]
MLFNRDPEKAAARAAAREERRAQRRAAADQRAQERLDLKLWRDDHPAETTLNQAARIGAWPSSKKGQTSAGPVRGGQAEFVNAGAHKAWTATRLLAGAATLGTSAVVTGRKNKGAAMINVTFGNGAAQTYKVTPESATLRAANQYVNAFNALAAQLDGEQ